MNLNYAHHVPTDDLLGRILGPDTVGGYVQVIDVHHDDGRTRARCRPVSGDQLAQMVRDEFGQLWLPLPAAVTADA